MVYGSRAGRLCWGFVNGRKLAIISGLLRNSTIFCCAKKLGLEQCSQKAPNMLAALNAA